jgi:similar to spore coat protein
MCLCITQYYQGKICAIEKIGGDPMANLALHEAMELHELINMKTISTTKSKMIQGVVFDQELRTLLERDVQQSMSALNTLQGLLNKNQPH